MGRRRKPLPFGAEVTQFNPPVNPTPTVVASDIPYNDAGRFCYTCYEPMLFLIIDGARKEFCQNKDCFDYDGRLSNRRINA